MNMKSTLTSLLVTAGLLVPSAFASNAFAKGAPHARSMSGIGRMKASPAHAHRTKTAKATARKSTKKAPKSRKVAKSKSSPKNGSRKVSARSHRRISPKAVGKVQVPNNLAKQKKSIPQYPQS